MTSTQMLKGILEGCLLAVISEQEVYGYEMTKKLESYGFDMISEGSIYPLLIRMKKEELVTTTTKASESGPKRKYYSITDKGKEELKSFISTWDNMSNCVNNLLKEKK
ncbi:PadR family transcriptional regulator [Romboutsia maritimum]|nr:PadR family transcriptional regulator [Romboutsia maritimum]